MFVIADFVVSLPGLFTDGAVLVAADDLSHLVVEARGPQESTFSVIDNSRSISDLNINLVDDYALGAAGDWIVRVKAVTVPALGSNESEYSDPVLKNMQEVIPPNIPEAPGLE